MLNTVDFVACIRDNLKAKHYGKERGDAIVKNFEGRAEFYKQAGSDALTANQLAMKDIFTTMSNVAVERAKRNAKMISLQAENKVRVAQGASIDTALFTMKDLAGQQVGPRGSRGKAIAAGVKSSIEFDPRFKGVKNYSTTKHAISRQLYALMADTLDHFGKGAFGVQRGKAHLPNIIKEAFGNDTNDVAAKQFARAWMKTQDVAVDLFNGAGGSMRKLKDYIPQGQNASKMVKAGFERWAKVHEDALDWNNMRRPDGSPIDPSEHRDVLQHTFDTLKTDGAINIDPTTFRGKGAIGNTLDDHRFLIYKDADSWLAVHNEFGDGTIYDVFQRHIADMAHRTALIDVYGPNPAVGMGNLEAEAKLQAAKIGGQATTDFKGYIKNRVQPMFDNITHANPMDPESMLGAGVSSVSNVIMAAQLGSATFAAAPGDWFQTVMVRALHNMGLFDGTSTYLKAIAFDKPFQEKMMAQTGWVSDEAISSVYATQRFSGLASQGPAFGRRIADSVMRLNMLSGHTVAARWAIQSELMGMMFRKADQTLDNIPEFQRLFQTGGISPEEWDLFRSQVKPYQPKPGVNMLAPVGLLDTNLPNRQELYQKFQGMIHDFALSGVPDATIEASTLLKGTTRPDTVPGAILHSFSMYKNFPVTYAMLYGRMAMTTKTSAGRLGFLAGLGAGMTLLGALSIQLRTVSKGQDPMPMDNAAFMGKAFLASGALSIWGDFLFSGINSQNQGPSQVLGGPLGQFVGDTAQVALGDVFKWADMAGTLGTPGFKSNTASKAVDWVKRYGPGTSLWWARLALEREVFDRLSELADPNVYAKRQQRLATQKKTYGNSDWWAPGQRLPSRGPSMPGG